MTRIAFLGQPGSYSDLACRTAFPGNVVPTTLLDPIALAIQNKYIPLPKGPNADAGLLVNNYYAPFKTWRITRTPADLLRLKKLAINRVVDIQGFRSAVMFGAEWDSISHASDGADEIRAKIRDMGLKEAIKWFSAD